MILYMFICSITSISGQLSMEVLSIQGVEDVYRDDLVDEGI